MCVHTTLCSLCTAFFRRQTVEKADAWNGIVLDYTKDAFMQVSDRRTPNCKHPVWPESSPPGPDPRIASNACQHITADA